MSKKLIILFIFIFFLSTTGLPISLHYCQMQKIVELSGCEVCSEEGIVETETCCTEESDFPIKLKADNSFHCCETKIIEASVKDGFLSAISIVKSGDNISLAPISAVISPVISNDGIVYYQFTDSSPPFVINHIYLLNSSFLI